MTDARVDDPIADEQQQRHLFAGAVNVVRGSSRKVKRAFLYSGRKAGDGLSWIGRGFVSLLPVLGVIGALIVLGAVIAGIVYLQYLWIQFAFGVSQFFGWFVVSATIFNAGFMLYQFAKAQVRPRPAYAFA